MGVVIVGGTIFSLVLTLFVIPALYFMWSRAKNIILNLNTSKNMKMKVNKMNNYKVLLIKIFILFCVVKMNAQELLTIEDAVKIALENNYAIKIAANELTIGKTNVSGNAGMLPRATASIIDNNNIINLSQTRTDGTIKQP
jgi:hypothetical protein